MSHKRITETTIEVHETWVLRRVVRNRWLCSQCIKQSEMFTLPEAAAMLCVSQLTIYRWVEGRRLHFRETPDGGLFVCLASMSAEVV